MSDTSIRTPAWGVTEAEDAALLAWQFQFAPPRGG